MTYSSDVALTVGGRIWTGWTEVTATAGLEQGAGAFQLTLRPFAPDGGRAPGTIATGSRCSLALAGVTVITGWIDIVEAGNDPRELTLTGRDATGDLIDCSPASKPGEWADVSLLVIVAAICKPFGISVTVSADLGKRLAKFRIDEGETAWEAIERACRLRAVLPLADGLGGLVLTTADNAPDTGVTLTDAVLKPGWRVRDDATGRFSMITVKAQAQGSDTVFGAAASGISGSATDAGVTRHRPRTLLSEEPADAAAAKLRAEWEVKVRQGRALTAGGPLAGWTTAGLAGGGTLWRPGRLVRLSSAKFDVDRQLLIRTVTWRKSLRGGTEVDLDLCPKSALARIAEGKDDTTSGGLFG